MQEERCSGCRGWGCSSRVWFILRNPESKAEDFASPPVAVQGCFTCALSVGFPRQLPKRDLAPLPALCRDRNTNQQGHKASEIKAGMVIQSRVPPAFPYPSTQVALPCSRAGNCCSGGGGKNHTGLCRLQGHVLHSTSSSRSLHLSPLRLVTGLGSQPSNPGYRSRGGAVSPPLPGTLSQAQAGAAPESPPRIQGSCSAFGTGPAGRCTSKLPVGEPLPPGPPTLLGIRLCSLQGQDGDRNAFSRADFSTSHSLESLFFLSSLAWQEQTFKNVS